MLAKENGESLVPGKTLTISSSFTSGTDMKTVVEQDISDNSIICPAVLITTKKKSQLSDKELTVAVINANGTIQRPFRYNAGSGTLGYGGTTWTDFNFTCTAGTVFYVIESNTESNSENYIPGKTITLSENITNGSNLKSSVESKLTDEGITTIAAMFTSKEQTQWSNREFVCVPISNGATFYQGYRKASGNNIEGKELTSTFDYFCSSGTQFYVVEVKE